MAKVLSQQIRKFLQNIVSSRSAHHYAGRRQRTRHSGESLESRQMLTTIDLATLTAGQGTTIFGANAGDFSGRSVSNAGDVNGDGFDDLIIGACFADESGNAKPDAGESYVIFGAPSTPATIDLNALPAAGIRIFGAEKGDNSGFAVSGAGDVNGDGFADLIIGARLGDASGNAKSAAGESYVIFGAASMPATIDLNAVGTAGITIFGAEEFDLSVNSVSGAGDVNGDGFDDLIIGARLGDGPGNTRSGAGESYVIFGAASLPTTIDLNALGTAGITIFGADADDESGFAVSNAGDVNGDGFDDLIIGAHLGDAAGNAKANAGESYVIFGAASMPATIDLNALGTAGIRIFGADNGDTSGVAVSSAGDVNGDGFDDLIVGAQFGDGLRNSKVNAGDAYVIFGAAFLPTTIDLNVLGTAGIRIFGADANDLSGSSVSSAGDVNGDGFDDLLIGAFLGAAANNAKENAGETYLIFGAASLPSTINLKAPTTPVITIFGVDRLDRSGVSVSGAGDVNGDGFDDLLIGADRAAAAGHTKSDAGESYLIFGGDFTLAVTHQGTAASETLTGNTSANVMIGGRGNDILIGNGGADVLRGGAGNDVLAVSSLTFNRIVGGTGSDTLRLDATGMSLDLTALKDNRIVDIETIDIIGSGNNTLTLGLKDVLNISSTSNTLTVRRDAGDLVNIGLGWTQGSDQTVSGIVYQVFTQGAATLKIQVADAGSMIRLAGKTLTITGTNFDDLVSISTATNITVAVNGITADFTPAQVTAIIVNGNDGSDTITMNSLPAGIAFTANGNNDNDVLSVSAAFTGATRLNGGNGDDILTGGSGNDTLIGGAGNDRLAGGLGNDTYVFATASAPESDIVTELSASGMDTLDFQSLSTSVSLNLGLSTVQSVHINRTLKLSAANVFENVTGGSGNDMLTGNSLRNRLNGGAGNDVLNGRGGNDTYVFTAATSAEADTLVEVAAGGSDTVSFASLTIPVRLSLGTTAVQSVHTNRTIKLNSTIHIENVIGGSGNDILTGNSMSNVLTGAAGNDILNGGAGSDKLVGGHGNDTYVFTAATSAEADTLVEVAAGGSDTVSFASLTIPVRFSLGTTAVQSVHTNRTIKLNSTIHIENVIGGSGNDILTGNSMSNVLVGGAGNDALNGGGGRDILIGGLGLDTLRGGDDEDILIAGRTTNDKLFGNLIVLQTEWTSANSYATRISNLRAGVGSPAVSLKAKVNVLNDLGEEDVLIGGNGTDWYFRALDDVITGLVPGEILDVL